MRHKIVRFHQSNVNIEAIDQRTFLELLGSVCRGLSSAQLGTVERLTKAQTIGGVLLIKIHYTTR